MGCKYSRAVQVHAYNGINNYDLRRSLNSLNNDCHVIEYLNESVLFGMIINNLEFQKLLHAFLKSEYSADNLEFYLAVQDLRAIMDTKGASQADTKRISEMYFKAFDSIVKTYVIVGTEMEINIQQVRSNILSFYP